MANRTWTYYVACSSAADAKKAAWTDMRHGDKSLFIIDSYAVLALHPDDIGHLYKARFGSVYKVTIRELTDRNGRPSVSTEVEEVERT